MRKGLLNHNVKWCSCLSINGGNFSLSATNERSVVDTLVVEAHKEPGCVLQLSLRVGSFVLRLTFELNVFDAGALWIVDVDAGVL